MIGPRWFQVLSISLGPAVVVGALLVHPEGVDFTLLRPRWLAIALFVAIQVCMPSSSPSSVNGGSSPMDASKRLHARLTLTVIFGLFLTELVQKVAVLT